MADTVLQLDFSVLSPNPIPVFSLGLPLKLSATVPHVRIPCDASLNLTFRPT